MNISITYTRTYAYSITHTHIHVYAQTSLKITHHTNNATYLWLVWSCHSPFDTQERCQARVQFNVEFSTLIGKHHLREPHPHEHL